MKLLYQNAYEPSVDASTLFLHIYIYIYLYTHTHIYIYSYAQTYIYMDGYETTMDQVIVYHMID
jgi:hypothetical protein